VESRNADLLAGHPEIDALHVYHRKPLSRLPRLVRELRRQRYDLALDMQGNLKSGALAFFSGAKRRMGVGGSFSREGNHLFVRERVEPPPGHKVEAYQALLDAAIGAGPRVYGKLHADGVQDHDSIVLHPGTSRFMLLKRWPAEHCATLADRLADKLARPVVLTAGPGERDVAEAVARLMRHEACIVEPKDLVELKRVLAGARIVIGGDTGPAHIAAALGVPTLALFGPTNPVTLAPYGPRARTIRAGVRCSPCRLRACPDPVCMQELTVDAAERAALELVA
jgi:heptosyltransferase-1